MHRWFVVYFTVLTLGLYGCGSGGGPGFSSPAVCTETINPGVAVFVTDSTPGAPAPSGASVVITDADYSETLTESPNVFGEANPKVREFRGAFERTGTYTVLVTRSGYASVERSQIVVTRDACGVVPQSVNVALTAL